MGEKAREFVRENFLITRNLREYLTLMVAIVYEANDRIELTTNCPEGLSPGCTAHSPLFGI